MKKVQAGGIIRESLDNTWQTPPEILDPVRVYHGGEIPLDPATSSDNPTRARKFYARPGPVRDRGPSLFTELDAGKLLGPNGLTEPWDDPFWLNPPFGEELKEWLAKIVAEASRLPTRDGIVLLPCSRWEQKYFTDVLEVATAVCYVRGRVAFISSIDGERVGGNPSASMLLGINANLARFARAFRDLGACFSQDSLAGLVS